MEYFFYCMMIKIGNIDFVEFLRFQTCIMTMLLVVQALDYVFRFGVNNYLFIIFCIVFAFTLGSVYYNIIITNNREEVEAKLKSMQDKIDEMSESCKKEENIGVILDSIINREDY